MAHLLHTDWSSKSEKEKLSVREQLDRILEHSAFKNSKRCSALFRHIVAHTISGCGASIKERTLGIEVFGRTHDYDTNTDPIVRATATEIRKRLAQYYHESGHESELRIELEPGSYIPEFRHSQSTVTPLAPIDPPLRRVSYYISFRSLKVAVLGGLAALAVIVAAGAGIWHVAAEPTPLNEFWSPVVSSPSPSVIIGVSGGCVNPGEYAAPNEWLPIPPRIGAVPSVSPPPTPPCLGMGRMAMHDAIAMARVAGVLQSKGKNFDVRPTPTIDYAELQKEPVVFIGLGSGWAVHIESQMRYRFKFDTGRNLVEIVDSKAPDENYWGIPIYWQDLPPGQMTRDYGLISRLTDPVTKQTVVTLAGAGAPGTIAVANFLSDPKYMRDVIAKAPKDWSKKNMQVVIQTDVINGRSGPPTYVASQFW